MSDEEYKICNICQDKTNCKLDLLLFGDWQMSRDITVHYFCLLLSTNLPQRGLDCSGINGFLIRDIRKEITAASKRLCCFCGRSQASIQCYNCKDYFHLKCGRQNRCLFTFYGDFRSYCNECLPRKELQPDGLKCRPTSFQRCSICREQMGLYNETIFIFGKCCNKGYAHSVCVQKYALGAGYYLRCLWCRSPEFRVTVRKQGIFVPDRDARWETQKGIYTDLHRGHNTCDMDKCFCPRGRDYNTIKWSIILCSLCGSVGAHNPKCLLGNENAKCKVPIFKCTTCARTESMVSNNDEVAAPIINNQDIVDKTIFVTKGKSIEQENVAVSFTPTFSDDDDTRSRDSFVTVIPANNSKSNTAEPTRFDKRNKQVKSNISMLNQNNTSVANANTTAVNIEKNVSEDIEVNKRRSSQDLHSTKIINNQHSQQKLALYAEDDEETQVFPISDANGTSVENVNTTTVNIEKDVTEDIEVNKGSNILEEEEKPQISRKPSPDTDNKIIINTQLSQQHLALGSQEDEETQVFPIPSPDIIEIKELLTKSPSRENIAEASSTTESTQKVPCSQPMNPMEDSYQSPVVTSSEEEWITFIVYEYDNVMRNCVGQATIRINLNEERFAGMTLEQIEEHSRELLNENDVISRSDDVGIFAQINAMIAKYM